MKVGTWRLSNTRMTICVKTDEDHKIIEAAPIAQKFKGQHINNLARWMQSMGNTDIMCLGTKVCPGTQKAKRSDLGSDV